MSDKFKGFKGRLDMKGFTSIPNEFFDEVLPEIKSLSELKVLLAVFRKTYGWVSHIDPNTGQPVYKEEDEIAMSQFMKLTGLSKPSCVDGVKRGLEDGYLERTKEGTFHGGDSLNNEAAAYRIKQIGDEPPIKTNVPNEPTGEVVKTEKTDMDFTDNADDDVESIMEEFFPSQKEEPAPKKSEPKGFKNKRPLDWNGRDLVAFFNHEYKKVLGIPAGPITVKDQTLAKQLLTAYNAVDLQAAIVYYLQNYKTISYLPSGYPAFNIFVGYKKSLIPEALKPDGKKASGGKNKSTREFDDITEEDGGGFVW